MRNVRVLLVNDQEEIGIKPYKLFLTRKFGNVAVDTATSNRDALGKLASRSYDAVFYDVGMDVCEVYYKIAERMKDQNPGAVLVATSAAIDSHNLPDFFDAYLNPRYFTERVQQLLKAAGGIELKLR